MSVKKFNEIYFDLIKKYTKVIELGKNYNEKTTTSLL